MSDKSPPRVMTLSEASFVPRFEYGDQAQVAQLCGADDGSKLGVGLVRMKNAIRLIGRQVETADNGQAVIHAYY